MVNLSDIIIENYKNRYVSCLIYRLSSELATKTEYKVEDNEHMSIKQEAHEMIDNLTDESTWDDLVKELYRSKKITLGMTDIEVVQDQLSEAEIATIMSRMQSSSSRPDDMRNTKTYNPDNSVTASWALVALAPLLFISILLAPVAYVLSVAGIFFGIKGLIATKKSAAWVPIAIGIIELILFIALPVIGS